MAFTYLAVAVSFCLVNLTDAQLEHADIPLPAGHAQGIYSISLSPAIGVVLSSKPPD